MHIQILKNVNLFSELDDASLELLAGRCIVRSYPKNAILINEGDESDSMYIIVTGKVKAFLRDEDGKEVILNFQREGDYFGELALLDGHPRSASVMTTENTKCAIISRAEFDRLLVECPEIALRLVRHLSKRLRALTENVKSLALMDVYGRVAKTLLDLAEPVDAEKMVIKQKLTQQDIANLVGSSREMVTRIMRDLTSGGYINVQGKVITINHRLPHAW